MKISKEERELLTWYLRETCAGGESEENSLLAVLETKDALALFMKIQLLMVLRDMRSALNVRR